MILDVRVAIALVLVAGLYAVVKALRERSRSTVYDGSPRTQVEATTPDGSRIVALMDPPRSGPSDR